MADSKITSDITKQRWRKMCIIDSYEPGTASFSTLHIDILEGNLPQIFKIRKWGLEVKWFMSNQEKVATLGINILYYF